MLSNALLWIWIRLDLTVRGFFKAIEEQVLDQHRSVQNLPKGEGKHIVITGGNRGIGFEAVKTFLSLGYFVIIGCRDPVKCEEYLRAELGDKVKSGNPKVIQVDLTSLESVRRFAQEVLEMNIPIHVLVNNAGIMFGKRTETKDGFESQMGINFLSHFLLTSLLLPKLREAGTPESKARIFNVSSIAHHVGSWMDLSDLQSKNFYSSYGAYGNSKAAQIMFTRYLNGLLASAGENVMVNCGHPGMVNTGLYVHVPFAKLLTFMMKTPAQGGESIVYGSISPELNKSGGGLYLDNSQPREPNKFCTDINNQRRLWFAALKLVGLEKFF